MFSSISPYELLKRSRPKEPASYITDYDLYSASQQPSCEHSCCSASQFNQEQRENSFAYHNEPSAYSPRKTHYVAGIQQRHQRASKQANMTTAALSAYPSCASFQLPPT